MKTEIRIIFLLLLVGFYFPVNAQTFTWMQGLDTINVAPVYGVKGVPSPNNTPGGRSDFVSWADNQNNYWVFGGFVDGGIINDLWKYDVSLNQWTWVIGDSIVNQKGIYGTMGIAGSINTPGAREWAVGWTDNSGNLWLFSGHGFDWIGQVGHLNDLWKYNPNTNEWTWIRGSRLISQSSGQFSNFGIQGVAASSNDPGPRTQSITWKDSLGHFWLFGGGGFSPNGQSGLFNDVWKYDIAANQWTWIKGSNIRNQSGIYGLMGVPDSLNNPGARRSVTGCADHDGNFWMFGGGGRDAFGSSGWLNDLWKYEPSKNEWTWMKGSNAESNQQNGFANYGIKGIACSACTPGARTSSYSWIDSKNNLWLFGGGDTGMWGFYNDLWVYIREKNEWVWVKGSDVWGQPGIYGIQGVPSLQNIPGARTQANSWTDTSGAFWLHGGVGYDGNGNGGNLGDLWKLTIEPLVIDSQSFTQVFCSLQSDTLWVAASGRETIFYQWYKNSSVIPGAANDSILINDINPNDSYWCMVYDMLDTLYSLPARLSVLNVSVSITNELLCYSSNDGEITITAQGGFGSLSYSIDGSNYQSGNTFSGLSAGTYTGFVSDSLGFICVTDSITLISQSPFVIETITTPVTDSTNGSIRIKVLSGGEPPYTFSIDGITFQDSIFNGLDEGSYVVTVRDSVGCEDTVNAYVDSFVGIEDTHRQLLIIVHPNPASDAIQVFCPSSNISRLTLMNINGKVVEHSIEKSQYATINTQHLFKGLYFVRIELHNGQQAVRKIVIQ